jgi:ribosomal protein L14
MKGVLFLAALPWNRIDAIASGGRANSTLHHTAADNVYGPGGCISLGRSSEGSCTLATNCGAHDISTFDFAFDCLTASGSVRHSFGVGGFDQNEDFDTEVVCDRCLAPRRASPKAAPRKKMKSYQHPAPQEVANSQLHQARLAQHPDSNLKSKNSDNVYGEGAAAGEAVVAAVASAAAAGDDDNDDVPVVIKVADTHRGAERLDANEVSYGPNHCVSVHKSKSGRCVMKTSCVAADIENFEFGFVCVDKEGATVRHLFGTNSFDPSEAFDTQVSCETCLGLEDMPGDMVLSGRVSLLSDEVMSLSHSLSSLTKKVNELNGNFLASTSKHDTGNVDTDGTGNSNLAALPQQRAAISTVRHTLRGRHRQEQTSVMREGTRRVNIANKRHTRRISSMRHHRHHQRSEDAEEMEAPPDVATPADDFVDQSNDAEDSEVDETTSDGGNSGSDGDAEVTSGADYE